MWSKRLHALENAEGIQLDFVDDDVMPQAGIATKTSVEDVTAPITHQGGEKIALVLVAPTRELNRGPLISIPR